MRHAVLLALLVGCGPGFVKLDPARARRLDVALVGGGTAVCPQSGVPQLRALVTYRDNQAVQTRSRVDPRGTLRPSELRWTSDVGSIDTDARLRLPRLLDWYDRPISITVSVPGRPDVANRIVLVPAFDCDAASSHDGPSGGTGGSGGNGRFVEVSLAYVDTRLNGRLVLARVSEGGREPAYYLIDRRGPAAARFVVSARGGDGGSGSDGMSGSSGSNGTEGLDGFSGDTCEDGGDGGDGGDGADGGDGSDGGDGGDGGTGGTIVIRYPEQFPELAYAIEVDVGGGRGGRGGSGGSGGAGGSGGRGGRGGSGGSTIAADGSTCTTYSGQPGRDGRDGRAGSSGNDGTPGRDGAPGYVERQASSIDALFAGEAVQGWPIVR
ncbi:MAG TPA: hypothetical protein VFS15_19105 [Kofleriaceae bacterium]|nr:hypothetical protein [Kofleriaceae bacterium]